MEKIRNKLDMLFQKIPYLFSLLNLYTVFFKRSFSQEGEDMVLSNMFTTNKGFYVDVGAHHPFRFSNTKYFYDLGWDGINIDPMPESMRLFNLYRKRDLNLELGVGKTEGIKSYYMFNEPALNGFDKKNSKDRQLIDGVTLTNKIDIKVLPLSKILNKYSDRFEVINFLSIDVEGLEYEVLQSNNWNKFRPKCVLVEMLGVSIESLIKNKVFDYLIKRGYTFFAKTGNTVFFITNEYKKVIIK